MARTISQYFYDRATGQPMYGVSCVAYRTDTGASVATTTTTSTGLATFTGLDEALTYRIVLLRTRDILVRDERDLAYSTPRAHASQHQNAGVDEISVAGLSGLLADAQTPLSHDILSGHAYTGGAALDVFGLSAASTLAKLTPSSNPGAASAILKTDASGYLQLAQLGIGIAPTYNLHVSCALANWATVLANTNANGFGLFISTAHALAANQLLALYSPSAYCFQVFADGGVVVGTPTGGTKGFGTINAETYYADTSIIMSDGAYIGQAAGPQVLFDDTNNLLEITGCSALIGTGTPSSLMTTGLLIHQGAADNEALALQSSDVAHGITSWADTITYAQHIKYSPTNGGLTIRGFSAGTVSIDLVAMGTTDDTAKTTAATGYVQVRAYKKSGTTVTNPGANANLFTIGQGSATRFIFDAEGSAHADVEWVAFDEYDDLALLDSLEEHMVKREFGQFLRYNRQALQQAGIVNFYDPSQQRAMLNTTRLLMLVTGACRQLGQRLILAESQLAALVGGS